MRRKEFGVLDRERMEEVLKKADAGSLAFNGPDGWPRPELNLGFVRRRIK